MEKFKAALGSSDRFIQFVLAHERYHQDQKKAGKKYPTDWLSPEAILIERKANSFALAQLGIPVASIRKSETLLEPVPAAPQAEAPVMTPSLIEGEEQRKLAKLEHLFGGSHLQGAFARGLLYLQGEELAGYVDDFIAASSKYNGIIRHRFIDPTGEELPHVFESSTPDKDLPKMFDRPTDAAAKIFREEVITAVQAINNETSQPETLNPSLVALDKVYRDLKKLKGANWAEKMPPHSLAKFRKAVANLDFSGPDTPENMLQASLLESVTVTSSIENDLPKYSAGAHPLLKRLFNVEQTMLERVQTATNSWARGLKVTKYPEGKRMAEALGAFVDALRTEADESASLDQKESYKERRRHIEALVRGKADPGYRAAHRYFANLLQHSQEKPFGGGDVIVRYDESRIEEHGNPFYGEIEDAHLKTVAEIYAEYKAIQAQDKTLADPVDVLATYFALFRELKAAGNEVSAGTTGTGAWLSDLSETQGRMYFPHYWANRYEKPTLQSIRESFQNRLRENMIFLPPIGGRLAEENRKENMIFLPPAKAEALLKKIYEAALKLWEETQGGRTVAERGLFKSAGARVHKGSIRDVTLETGWKPQTFDIIEAVQSYTLKETNNLKKRRYLTFLATTTDISGMPMIFMASDKGGIPIDKWAVRTMVLNTLDAMKRFGLKDVPEYQTHLDEWDNARAVMKFANGLSQGGWFSNMGFEKIDPIHTALRDQDVWIRSGETRQLLDHITSRGLDDIEASKVQSSLRSVAKSIHWYNALVKHIGLAFSFFHLFALFEEYGATKGLSLKNPFLWPVRFPAAIKEIRKLHDDIINNPESFWRSAPWHDVGLKLRAAKLDYGHPDSDAGALDNALTFFIKKGDAASWRYGSPIKLFGKGARGLRAFKRAGDKFLWEVVQPALKLLTAEQLYNQYLANPAYSEFFITPKGERQMREVIARTVNKSFGGLNWVDMIWATPKARGLLSLGMFAPDWTISALQASMIPNVIASITRTRNPLSIEDPTGFEVQYRVGQYWPAYILVTLLAVPMALQAAFYAAFGDPEKGDQRWMVNNEKGKRDSVDLTPLMRATSAGLKALMAPLGLEHSKIVKFLSYDGGKGSMRRGYGRWGKSFYELEGWLRPTEVFHTLMGKSSPVVKTAIEQFFNQNSAGHLLPWAKPGAITPMGGLLSVNNSFMESRLGYFARTWVPMTFMNLALDRPPSFMAQTTQGKSEYAAQLEIGNVMYAYGNEEMWTRMTSKPNRVRNLRSLVVDTLAAVRLNGGSIKATMSAGASMARAKYYAEFFAELNKNPRNPDVKALTTIAKCIVRLNGKLNALKVSNARRSHEAQPLTQEQIKARGEAYWLAMKEVMQQGYWLIPDENKKRAPAR